MPRRSSDRFPNFDPDSPCRYYAMQVNTSPGGTRTHSAGMTDRIGDFPSGPAPRYDNGLEDGYQQGFHGGWQQGAFPGYQRGYNLGAAIGPWERADRAWQGGFADGHYGGWHGGLEDGLQAAEYDMRGAGDYYEHGYGFDGPFGGYEDDEDFGYEDFGRYGYYGGMGGPGGYGGLGGRGFGYY
ncbi:hypothetical protein ACN47E_002572 [Coniothyrium glycines]